MPMLTFDAFQRCETVRHLLNWSLPGPSRLLDVGGYPGRMRAMLPQHEWVICDPRVDSSGFQVRGDAAALPFQDQSFDFIVSLDVLEHIAPAQRGAALEEMFRVSRQGLILSFPHKHPLVEAAEQHVREAYFHLHEKEHPWLSEHARYELPDPQAITELLLQFGGQAAVFDVGQVSRWVYLQLVDILLEAMPNSLETAEELNQLYENLLYVNEFQAPAYRKIILHLFHAEEPISLAMIEPERNEEAKAEIEFHKRVTLGLLDLVSYPEPEPEPVPAPAVVPLPAVKTGLEAKEAAKAASTSSKEEKPADKAKEVAKEDQGASLPSFDSNQAGARQMKEPEPVREEPPRAKKSREGKPGSLQPEIGSFGKRDLDTYRDYIARLERGLQAWETTYTDTIQEMTAACRWRTNLEQRRSFKLYKRILRLFGQKIEA